MSEGESLQADSASRNERPAERSVMPTAVDQWAQVFVWFERNIKEAKKGIERCEAKGYEKAANFYRGEQAAFLKSKRKIKRALKSHNASPQEGTSPTS